MSVETPWLHLWPQCFMTARAIFSLLQGRLLYHTPAACIITGLYLSPVLVGKRDMTQKGFH